MFIQMVEGRCSRQDEMRGLVDDWCGVMADRPGWLGGTYGFTDDDRFVGVVRFDSRDACREACDAPDAGMWWAAAEGLFDGKCRIHESDDVSMMLEGGSDSAGFVQVMCGRVADADKLRHLMIIGATLAIEEDGSFVETVAFTDEDSARKGEKLERPEEMGREFQSAMSDVEYLDLHRPWFATHR